MLTRLDLELEVRKFVQERAEKHGFRIGLSQKGSDFHRSAGSKFLFQQPVRMTQRSPFRYFKTSPEIIRLAVMMYVRFPLSLRNVQDLLHERGIDICQETVRFWWNRFGPMFAAEIRKRRVSGIRSSHWRWHLDVVFGVMPESW